MSKKKRTSKLWKIVKFFAVILSCLFLLLMWAWFQVWTSPARLPLKVITIQTSVKPKKASNPSSFRVMTINLAHGRSDGWSQLFLPKKTIQGNLSKIAKMLRRESPDVVALQEADGANWWSRGFHHIRFLAKKAGYPYVAFAPLVQAFNIRYGTALISRLPLKNAYQLRFRNGFPMVGKGIVIASIFKPGFHSKPVDLISLHLDPPRASMRAKQLKELHTFLQSRKNKSIVMGDFNTEWGTEQSELPRFVKAQQLVAFQPQSNTLTSFPFLSRRLDWILIPSFFQFQNYRHLPDIVSDHKAVMADIKKVTKSASKVTPTSSTQQMVQRVASIHGAAGPFAMAGYRMAQHALHVFQSKRWDWSLRVVHQTPKRVQWSCIADGVQAATGVSAGKLSLRIKHIPASDQTVTIFTHRKHRKALLFRLQPSFVKQFLNTPRKQLKVAAQNVATLPASSIFSMQVKALASPATSKPVPLTWTRKE